VKRARVEGKPGKQDCARKENKQCMTLRSICTGFEVTTSFDSTVGASGCLNSAERYTPYVIMRFE
jgi:hypothetical protein